MTNNSNSDNKRLNIFIGSAVLVIAALTVVIWVLSTKDSDDAKTDEILADVQISVTDQAEVSTVVDEFINGASNFGFRTDGISSGNITDVQYLVSHSPNSARSLFTSRDAAYGNVREYIFKASPRFFNSNVTGSWSNEFETQLASTFRLDKVTVDVKDKGAYLNIGGTDRLTAYVSVTFSSTQTIRNKTADDSSWDGTFNVLEKGFPDNTADITLVQDENLDWKIYAINNLKYEFLLASWQNPDVNAYSDVQRDFVKVGTIKSDIVDNYNKAEEE